MLFENSELYTDIFDGNTRDSTIGTRVLHRYATAQHPVTSSVRLRQRRVSVTSRAY